MTVMTTGLERVAEEAGDDRGAQQNQDQGVLELREQGVPRGLRRCSLQFVGPMGVQPPRRLAAVQAGRPGRELLDRACRPTRCATLQDRAVPSSCSPAVRQLRETSRR